MQTEREARCATKEVEAGEQVEGTSAKTDQLAILARALAPARPTVTTLGSMLNEAIEVSSDRRSGPEAREHGGISPSTWFSMRAPRRAARKTTLSALQILAAGSGLPTKAFQKMESRRRLASSPTQAMQTLADVRAELDSTNCPNVTIRLPWCGSLPPHRCGRKDQGVRLYPLTRSAVCSTARNARRSSPFGTPTSLCLKHRREPK